MGKRGPKRTPENLKVLSGTFRASRDHATAKPAPLAGDPPGWLPVEAKEKWSALAPLLQRLGLLTAADSDEFARYCLFHARAVEAEGDIEARGLLVKSARGDGQLIKNVSVQIARDYHQACGKIADKFGLNPLNRQNVAVQLDEEPSEMDLLLSSARQEARERKQSRESGEDN